MNTINFNSALITGGAGFIGSYIAEKLIESGIKVKVLDNLITGKKENLENCWNKKNFEFPMGWIDKGEKPLSTAKRELAEETGYISLKNPIKLLEFYADPGRGNRTCHCYFIDKLKKYKKSEKGIKVFLKNKKQIIKMIKNKRFNNGAHIAAFNYYINKY